MEEPKKKNKLPGYIFLLAGVALIVAAAFLIFTSSVSSKSDEQNAVDVFEATEQDQPVYIDVQYMSESVAVLEAVESMQYYITFDSEWNPAVICLYDSEMDTYEPYIDWLFTEETEGGPEELRVVGYSVPFDEELEEYVIENFNYLFGGEYVDEDNFDEYFGKYYVAVGQNSTNFERFNRGVYCAVGAVICIIIGIALIYEEPKQKNQDTAYTNILEVQKPKSNLGMGIIGALLGALLGGVLWTVVGSFGYISGWIGLLIVFCANFGYKMFAREDSTFGTVISVIFSLIVILPATYLTGVWDFYKALNESIPEYVTLGRAFRELPDYLTREDEWSSMIYNICIGYIFMIIFGLGMFCSNRQKKKQESMQKNNIQTFANPVPDVPAQTFGNYSVELTVVGPNIIKVIKEVRESTGLGLAEAKNLVDTAPSIIKQNISREEAESIKTRLEVQGAVATIK